MHVSKLQSVKNTSSRSNAVFAQVKTPSQTTSQPKAGMRFLGFLISALGAWAV
jgi:hypothetical protein